MGRDGRPPDDDARDRSRRRRAGPRCCGSSSGRCRSPGAGEVLIRVAAAGVNRPDVLQRAGIYPPPPGAPSILGLEVAGRGRRGRARASSRELIGQPVCALVAGGGYAEYAVAPAGQCLPVPASAVAWSRRRRCPRRCSPCGPTCSSAATRRRARRVLVHGGTSGIGTMAIALGKLFGADGDRHLRQRREMRRGAGDSARDHAINYKTQDFVAEVKAITGGAGVDGRARHGRRRLCAAQPANAWPTTAATSRSRCRAARRPTIPIFEIMRRRLTLTGSTLRPRSVEFKTAGRRRARADGLAVRRGGRLKPVIDRTFPLAEAAEAHRADGSGRPCRQDRADEWNDEAALPSLRER